MTVRGDRLQVRHDSTRRLYALKIIPKREILRTNGVKRCDWLAREKEARGLLPNTCTCTTTTTTTTTTVITTTTLIVLSIATLIMINIPSSS